MKGVGGAKVRAESDVGRNLDDNAFGPLDGDTWAVKMEAQCL